VCVCVEVSLSKEFSPFTTKDFTIKIVQWQNGYFK
jgi:hypothetical protein